MGVLDKAVAILDLLSDGRRRNLAEVGAGTGLPRATAHRLVNALVKHRLVSYRPGEGWGLGPHLLALAGAARPGGAVAGVAGPPLEELRQSTQESVQLYVREGETRVCLVSLESPHSLRTIVRVGAVLPLDRGSAGAVLRDDPEVRRRGWAQSVEEREKGVASVSAPVRRDGEVVAAVSVSGPVERTTRQPGRRYSEAVVAAAAAVERAAFG